MPKNGFPAAFTLAAMLLLAACGGDAAESPEDSLETAPAVEYDGEPTINPAVTEGAIMMDTTTPGTQPAPAAQDTAA